MSYRKATALFKARASPFLQVQKIIFRFIFIGDFYTKKTIRSRLKSISVEQRNILGGKDMSPVGERMSNEEKAFHSMARELSEDKGLQEEMEQSYKELGTVSSSDLSIRFSI